MKLVDELGTINRRTDSVHPIIITSQRATMPPLDIQIPAGTQIRLEQNTRTTIFAFI